MPLHASTILRLIIHAPPGADLDLTLVTDLSKANEIPMEVQRKMVETLAEVLEESGQMSEIHARPNARVPIVALTDAETGLKCDICMCNILALINSRLLK